MFYGCVEIKCQLDATEVFIADLIACSTCFGHHYAHHQELKNILQWLLPVVFRAMVFKLVVWCGAEGYVSGLQDAGQFMMHGQRNIKFSVHSFPDGPTFEISIRDTNKKHTEHMW